MISYMQQIKEACQQAADYGVEVRRHLHCHPELSGLEFATVRYIQTQLTALGIPWRDIPDGGVLGVLEGPAAGQAALIYMRPVSWRSMTRCRPV